MQADVKLNELRVGNILFSNGEYVQVDYSDGLGNFKVVDFENPNSYPNPMNDKQAIVLDSDTLTRCGFSPQREEEDLWHISGLLLHEFDHGWVRWVAGNFHNNRIIHYLHELQNLYFDVTNRQLTFTPHYRSMNF